MVVQLMTFVVLRMRKSINAAYGPLKKSISVSLAAVYDKVNRMEPEVSAALVRETSADMAAAIDEMKGRPAVASSLPRHVLGWKLSGWQRTSHLGAARHPGSDPSRKIAGHARSGNWLGLGHDTLRRWACPKTLALGSGAG